VAALHVACAATDHVSAIDQRLIGIAGPFLQKTVLTDVDVSVQGHGWAAALALHDADHVRSTGKYVPTVNSEAEVSQPLLNPGLRCALIPAGRVWCPEFHQFTERVDEILLVFFDRCEQRGFQRSQGSR